MSCKCAIPTDEYHGWECSITEGAYMFLFPNEKQCAEIYGEGPCANHEETSDMDCDLCKYAEDCYNPKDCVYLDQEAADEEK